MSKKIWILGVCIGVLVVTFSIYAVAILPAIVSPGAPIAAVPPKSKLEVRDEERNAAVAAGVADYFVTSKADSSPPEIVFKFKTIQELTAKAAKEATSKSEDEIRESISAAQNTERAEAVKKGLAEYLVTIDDKGKPIPVYKMKTATEIANKLFRDKAAETVNHSPAQVKIKPVGKADEKPPANNATLLAPGE